MADYSIEVDSSKNLVRITASGFFDVKNVDVLISERNKAYDALKCYPHDQLTLVDIRNMDIQSQEIVSIFQKILNDPTYWSKRLAFVVAKSLARLQAKRAASLREARFFPNPEEAEAWLLAAD